MAPPAVNSQTSLPVEFGLGKFRPLEEVTVRWPCGRADTYTDIHKNAFVIIEEGNPTVTYDEYIPIPVLNLSFFIIMICILGLFLARYNH